MLIASPLRVSQDPTQPDADHPRRAQPELVDTFATFGAPRVKSSRANCEVHPPQVKEQALELIAAGLNDCAVARRAGIPRTTIRDWRRAPYSRRPEIAGEACPRCWRAAKPMRFSAADYAELLAIYLGDGCISVHPRTQRLRIHLDTRYPVINREITQLLRRCFPGNSIGAITPSRSAWSGRSDSWMVLSIYSSHLACLFHGTVREESTNGRSSSSVAAKVGRGGPVAVHPREH